MWISRRIVLAFNVCTVVTVIFGILYNYFPSQSLFLTGFVLMLVLPLVAQLFYKETHSVEIIVSEKNFETTEEKV